MIWKPTKTSLLGVPYSRRVTTLLQGRPFTTVPAGLNIAWSVSTSLQSRAITPEVTPQSQHYCRAASCGNEIASEGDPGLDNIPKDERFGSLGADEGGHGCSITSQGHAAAVLVLCNLRWLHRLLHLHGKRGDKGGLFPGAGEEKRAATFTFLSFTCVSLRFVFTLLLGLRSLELQEPLGKGSSLQGEATAWPLRCRGARTSRGTALPAMVSPSALGARGEAGERASGWEGV